MWVPIPVLSQHRTTERESEPVKTYGPKSAPITMEVFSDFQCPSCRTLYEQTLRPLINDYVASGKVYLIHRDFPLQAHQYGMEAARWGDAAARIGKFPDVEAALYDNQASWSTDGNVQKYVATALSAAEMKRVERMVEACHGNSAVAPAKMTRGTESNHGCVLDSDIEKDTALGHQVPVQQTPTSIVTYKGQHYPVIGVVSYPILKQFFDSLLRQ
jgi:protein-disulfide isomerase